MNVDDTSLLFFVQDTELIDSLFHSLSITCTTTTTTSTTTKPTPTTKIPKAETGAATQAPLSPQPPSCPPTHRCKAREFASAVIVFGLEVPSTRPVNETHKACIFRHQPSPLSKFGTLREHLLSRVLAPATHINLRWKQRIFHCTQSIIAQNVSVAPAIIRPSDT